MSYVVVKRETPKPKRVRRFWNLTLWLVGINVLFYLIVIILMNVIGEGVFNNVALQPSAILQGEKLWTIFTSMFMHDPSIFGFHLLANMMSLIFLGGFIEKIIGSKRFIVLYLLSGLIASLFFIGLTFAFNGDLTIPAIGASGAIFGIAGLAAILVPKMKVYIMFIPIAMPMWFATIFLLLIMWLASGLFGLSIGNFAHLGGFLTGIVYGIYIKIRYKKSAKLISTYFSRR